MENESANVAGPASRGRYRILSVKSLIVLIVLFTIFAVVFVFGLRKVERAVAFHPVRTRAGETWVVPTLTEDVWFSTKDGQRLHGWFFQPRTATLAKATIIYFHGNGGNIKNIGWLGEELAA